MLRLVVRGMRQRGEAELPPQVPRRKPAVERDNIALDARLLERYLRATEGHRIARLHGADAVVSPVFPATWETALSLELLAGLDQPLPSGGMVHLESELLALRPISAADHVRCRVELERAERVRRGIRLTLNTRNWTAAGQLCTQGTVVLLARTRAPADNLPREAGRGSSRDEGDPRAEPPSAWDEAAEWRLGGGAGRRYAAVSGDYNPIHLWSWTARPFGFQRPILHGFCTQAMVAHALVEHRFGGDPAALRRLRIAFRAPLLLPGRARLLLGERLGQRWFRVVGEDDEKVFAEGTYAGGQNLPKPQLTLVR